MSGWIQSGRFGAAWTPLSVAGLVYWYDFSDTATITHASNAVSAVTDKSGNSRTISQGTAGKKPTTNTVTRNGLNVLSFDGGDVLSSANFTQAQPITAFIVARSSLTDAANRQALGNGGTTPTIYMSSAYWRIYALTDLNSLVATDTNWHIFTGVFNNTSSSLRLDRSTVVSGAAGAAGYSTKPVSVGSDSGLTAGWAGEIAEVFAYSSVLSTTDRDAAETYCARWGL